MSTLTLYCRYTAGLFIFIAGSVISANMAFAGEITYPVDSYDTGDTLTADDLNAKFNQIKSAVNDNNDKNTLNDLSCTSGQVAKWNGTAWECVGAAGVEFAPDPPPTTPTDADNIPLDTDNYTIQSVSVSAPGPGYILVSFSTTYRLNHTNGTSDLIEIGISDTETTTIALLPSRRFVFLDSGFASGNFYGTIASDQVFEVSTGGTYTYHVLGRSDKAPPGSASFSVSRPATQAVFVPNRY